jgi:4-hydroxythreonine-4-phosphate dehydrogenase
VSRESFNKKIVITTGDPNGIGAEITLKALAALDLPPDKVVLVSNREIVGDVPYEVIEVPLTSAGEFSFRCLEKACELGLPIVTAPVSKAALHAAGHEFNGQTEVLEHFFGGKAEMLFVAQDMKVLLLTRHVPLKEVNLTKEMVVEKVISLQKNIPLTPALSRKGRGSLKFALCGLNPHAGEGGILGREEIEILIPAAQALREKGIDITDPLPADTLFADHEKYDCIIANYHDQGLIPIKTLYGRRVVNMTIGLSVIRTSPPHGTAFDIAGRGKCITGTREYNKHCRKAGIADPTGMIEAIKAVL